MTTITVLRPTTVNAPRATAAAAALFVQLLGWAEQRSSARSERRAAATRNAEASALRQYALRHTNDDPRFTADLMAAADRHEMGL